jgi:tripartite-type tricarboxylate transporter receptor subunit TctC
MDCRVKPGNDGGWVDAKRRWHEGRDMRMLRLILSLLACAAATGAAAQYPDRPIRLIVPQAAGSATDTVARILGAELGKELAQQIVVDNRPGGALTIGLDLTAKAEPDGYTICMGPIGALAITRHMVAKLPYDIERDLQPVAVVTRGHLLLAVSPTVPFKSVPELIASAKDNPGKLLNASSSNGSPGHVGGELFKYMSGTDIVHVPYRGGAPAINDLIAGRVHLMFESLNSIAPHARSGAVRPLGVSGARRSPGFPDLPTIAEAGVPGYAAPTWSGVIAPAGVPRPIIDKLNAAINRAIQSQTFRDRFAVIGDEPAGGTPEEFAELIRTDSAKWAEVVRRSGARLD